MLHFIWTIVIGFVAGLIARAVTPGDKGPQGFILTAILGIVGALAATYLGQAIGWYGPGSPGSWAARGSPTDRARVVNSSELSLRPFVTFEFFLYWLPADVSVQSRRSSTHPFRGNRRRGDECACAHRHEPEGDSVWM